MIMRWRNLRKLRKFKFQYKLKAVLTIFFKTLVHVLISFLLVQLFDFYVERNILTGIWKNIVGLIVLFFILYFIEKYKSNLKCYEKAFYGFKNTSMDLICKINEIYIGTICFFMSVFIFLYRMDMVMTVISVMMLTIFVITIDDKSSDFIYKIKIANRNIKLLKKYVNNCFDLLDVMKEMIEKNTTLSKTQYKSISNEKHKQQTIINIHMCLLIFVGSINIIKSNYSIGLLFQYIYLHSFVSFNFYYVVRKMFELSSNKNFIALFTDNLPKENAISNIQYFSKLECKKKISLKNRETIILIIGSSAYLKKDKYNIMEYLEGRIKFYNGKKIEVDKDILINEIYFFNDYEFFENETIYYNLTVGLPYRLDYVKSLCEKLRILDIINDLPKKFDTVIENSSSLSLLARTKINLIRGILIEPRMLVLDNYLNILSDLDKKIYLDELRTHEEVKIIFI